MNWYLSFKNGYDNKNGRSASISSNIGLIVEFFTE